MFILIRKLCGNELHLYAAAGNQCKHCYREPAQKGITTCAIQKIHTNLHAMQQNKLTLTVLVTTIDALRHFETG